MRTAVAFATLLAAAGVSAVAHAQAPAWEATDRLVPLSTWVSSSLGDNRMTTDPAWRGYPGKTQGPNEYTFLRVDGWVFNPLRPQPAGTVPMYGWYNPTSGDYLTTSNAAWAGNPGDTKSGYAFQRLEGYVYPGSVANTVPLNKFWNGSTQDEYTTTVWTQTNVPPGYIFGGFMGNVFPGNARSDLRAYQIVGLPTTSGVPGVIRNQGPRNTCTSFSSTAAVEALLRRNGVTLDLSEDGLNYFTKMFWLDDVKPSDRPANDRENQIGIFGGGNGTGSMQRLSDAGGMRLPREAVMPYRPGLENTPDAPAWNSPDWTQELTNEWNLGPLLPQAVLEDNQYARVSGLTLFCGGGASSCSTKTLADYEAVLRAGHEIVWDVTTVAGNKSGPIWKDPTSGGGAHSMLIVGYDRTDPANPYLIVKNSWGATGGGSGGDCGEGGFTCIAPTWLTKTGNASYATGASLSAWNELRFVGRWNLDFDGFKVILDINRPPGVMQGTITRNGVNEKDRRLGTLFYSDGSAYRVNGEITGDKIRFRFDKSKPNLTFEELQGRDFVYYISGDDNQLLAGSHTNPNGSVYGGYATKGGYKVGHAGGGTGAQLWLGKWTVEFDGRRDRLELTSVNGATVAGKFYPDDGTQGINVTATISKRRATFTVGQIEGRILSFNVDMLSWEKGIFAGVTYELDGSPVMGVVAARRP